MSKVRILYVVQDSVYTNNSALRMAESHFEAYGLPAQQPIAYKKWPRWKKAQWKVLNTALPRLSFKVFREPRNTRAGRSLFYSEVVKAGGIIPEKAKAKRFQMRNGNRIDFADEAGESPIQPPVRRRVVPAAGIRVVGVQAPEVGGH